MNTQSQENTVAALSYHKSYHISQKIIHWIMAFMIMLDLFVAQKFGGEMEVLDRLDSRIDHSTMGLIVLSLLVIRIVLRLSFRSSSKLLPSDRISPSGWQDRLAKATHLVMYLLMLTLVLSGLLSAMHASDAIMVFGTFDINLFNGADDRFLVFRSIHEWATHLLIATIVLHIVAALYHHFILKDKVMIDMFKK